MRRILSRGLGKTATCGKATVMLCKADGVKLTCLETRTYDDGTVRRRYRCPLCNKVSIGVEEIVENIDTTNTYYETRAQRDSRMFRLGKRAQFQRMEEIFRAEVDRIDNELEPIETESQ